VRKVKKCSKELYCQFLIAAQTNFTATHFSEICGKDIAHDAISRFLSRTKLTPKMLWEYTEPLIQKEGGYIICDDTVLDHLYGENIKLTRWQYSGTHHDVVRGIGVTTLLWTNQYQTRKDALHIPIDYRIYAPQEDGYTKNQHFREMVLLSHHRGLSPKMVIIDSWYSSLENLKLLRTLKWVFVAGVRRDRVFVPVPHVKKQAHELDIPDEGLVIYLRAFGLVKLFKLVTQKGNIDYFITNDLSSSLKDVRDAVARRWKIEEYHRGVKQTVGIENCQSQTARSQRTHIFCSILSFIALEKKRWEEGITWYESKRRIIGDALILYLKQPLIKLPNPVG
jgi:hypothetical protein